LIFLSSGVEKMWVYEQPFSYKNASHRCRVDSVLKGLAKDLKGGYGIRRRGPASEQIVFFLVALFQKKGAG